MYKPRLDRLVSIGVVHPALRIIKHSRRARVPVLMYHGVRVELTGKGPYFEVNTSPRTFEAQMRYLSDNGYRTITLDEALRTTEDRPDEKRIVITFDDGFEDFYTQACPVLTRYGFTAAIFVVSGFAGEASTTSSASRFMTWSQVREIRSLGMAIGSHTVSHPELWRLPQHELWHELKRSKEEIEDALGGSIQSFSHPFAFPEQDTNYVKTLRSMLERCGYDNGVSTIIGTVGKDHSKFHLPRLPVNEYDDERLFGAKLAGAYDWLHVAQRAWKSLPKRRGTVTPAIG